MVNGFLVTAYLHTPIAGKVIAIAARDNSQPWPLLARHTTAHNPTESVAQGRIAAHHNDIPDTMARHHRSQTLHCARSVTLHVVVVHTALFKIAAYLFPATMAAFVGTIYNTPGHL